MVQTGDYRHGIFFFLLCVCFVFPGLTGCGRMPTGAREALEDHRTSRSAFVLALAGDVLLSPNCSRRPLAELECDNCGYGDLMRPARSFLKGADAAFCNLESPRSMRGTAVPGKLWNFRAAPHAVKALTESGFNVVSVANNHILDYGSDAFADTLSHLERAGIRYTGVSADGEQQNSVVIEAKGVRIAFLAYANVYPADYYHVPLRPVRATRERVRRDIAQAKEQADHVIISIHWGMEYKAEPDPEQISLAHFMIDEGASVVAGHHAHVLQDPEYYRGGVIFYSLGNFLFMQGRLRTPETRVYALFLNKDAIVRVSYIPFDLKVNPWRMVYTPFSRRAWRFPEAH